MKKTKLKTIVPSSWGYSLSNISKRLVGQLSRDPNAIEVIKLRLISNHVVQILDLYFVLGIAKHLLSVGQATTKGMMIKFSKQPTTMYIRDDQHEIKLYVQNMGNYFLSRQIKEKH